MEKNDTPTESADADAPKVVVAERRILDHGFVRLVESKGGDLSVVRAARVSYNAAWRAGRNENSDEKLIHSLMRRSHSSPFEHVTLTFDVRAPIFVFRQWHRHRTWSYSEVSARYSELEMGYFTPEHATIGAQSTTDKQGRTANGVQFNPVAVAARIRDHNLKSEALYRDLLEQGVSRELARVILPVSTYSQMFATVSLWNLFRFCQLRSDPHAQYEIRVYSDALLDLAREVAPISVEAFIETSGLREERGG